MAEVVKVEPHELNEGLRVLLHLQSGQTKFLEFDHEEWFLPLLLLVLLIVSLGSLGGGLALTI